MFDASLFGADYSRRDFMKSIATLTAVMGLPATMIPKVAAAAQSDNRPPVIWLHFQECTGCTTSMLRTRHPGLADLLLDIIDLQYHETLMVSAGFQAEELLLNCIKENKGKYICIVEGAVPLGEDGIFCKVHDVKAKDSISKAARDALCVINYGTCSALGGISAAAPNPTGAVSGAALVHGYGVPMINIPGCPPNPLNLTACVLYFLTMGELPKLDNEYRPLFAYDRLIHEHCERRPHFDAGRFAKDFNDHGHRLGWCLYELGCKGPGTHANCSILRFNEGIAWPVSIGHPCIGCTEHLIFNTSAFDRIPVQDPTSPNWFAPTTLPYQGKPASAIAGVAVGAITGAALGYAAGKGKSLPEE